MKHLYDPADVAELTARIARVTPESRRRWGKMDAAQMLAHCAVGMEWAVDDVHPKRLFIGRLIAPLVRRSMTETDTPMGKSSPTAPSMIITDARDLARERARLTGLVERFAAAGPPGCTTHPHTFFGPLTPRQWAVLMYKHIDHHLQQFGA